MAPRYCTIVRVRPYTDADLEALERMHREQGFDYRFPDLADPIFLTRLVLEDDARAPVMASLVRLTSEVYLLHDPRAGAPRERWERLLMLHEATRRDALARGLEDAHAFLPPPVARSFGRRLRQLGWVQDPWTCFSRKLEA